MNVLTDRGLQIGKLQDILVDEESGRIHSIIVKPVVKEALENLPKEKGGNALLPFSAVMAIRDYIVVNERVLVIQQVKKATVRPVAEAPTPAAPSPPTESQML
jgi:sporulation protein YlmC with PRC-barrel domain